MFYGLCQQVKRTRVAADDLLCGHWVSTSANAVRHTGDIDFRVFSGDKVQLGSEAMRLGFCQKVYFVRRGHYRFEREADSGFQQFVTNKVRNR